MKRMAQRGLAQRARRSLVGVVVRALVSAQSQQNGGGEDPGGGGSSERDLRRRKGQDRARR